MKRIMRFGSYGHSTEFEAVRWLGAIVIMCTIALGLAKMLGMAGISWIAVLMPLWIIPAIVGAATLIVAWVIVVLIMILFQASIIFAVVKALSFKHWEG